MRRFLLIASVLTSCTAAHRYVYSPSVAVNPFFKEKGDSKLAMNYTVGDGDNDANDGYNKGYDIQSAYAFASKWAATFDHFYRREEEVYNTTIRHNIFDSSIVNYKRKITSAGLGYFMPINKRKTVTFNLYGGVGFGKFLINDKGLNNSIPYTRFHNAHITQWYLQPGLNFMKGNYFWCSFTARLIAVKYSRVTTSYYGDELSYFNLDNLSGKTLTFLEPSFNMQIGIPHCKWLKIYSGITLSSDINNYKNEENSSYYLSRSMNAFVGINFNFTKLWRK